jgi:hypothetical protein
MKLRRFELGRVVGTPAALECLSVHYTLPADLLDRHASCDWGDLCEDDRQTNEAALQDGSRLFSSYTLAGSDETVWIITEAVDDSGHRACTTVMLPSEY